MRPCSKILGALAVLVFSLAQPSAQGLATDARVENAVVETSAVLRGFVLEAGGTPAVGAVVVSSAGGQAVTERDGSYTLSVRVSAEAERVQVSAVGSLGSGAASTSALLSSSGVTHLPPLVLALGATCTPEWLPTFGTAPGVDGMLCALVVFDDGSGPALYAGGTFTRAGDVEANRIAKWDGARWSALGEGMDDTVLSLAVYDDGAGARLYAGGGFTRAGEVNAQHIARWDGASWAHVRNGTNGPVHSLTTYDDGSGPGLVAGGFFSTADGVAANRIARWNGASWSALGSGMSNGTVQALAVYDYGAGQLLYAGGTFTRAGGLTASRIALWNGTSWSALGGGMNAEVRALAVFDDGGGPALYAGGLFTSAGSFTFANHIARWRNASWSALGNGMDSFVSALAVFDDGSGPALHAGGAFTSADGVAANRVARWNGASWSAFGDGLGGQGGLDVQGLAMLDTGNGPELYAGGNYATADGLVAHSIAAWSGTSWRPLGSGLDPGVYATTVFDDGNGPALYAGGSFTTAGGVPVNRIARWDGTSWSTLGSGMNGFADVVFALAVFDDGSGPALYAGGNFTTAGGVSATEIAKWDGSSWSALGSGTNDWVFALTVFDDGNGPALYAGGGFTQVDGVAANSIAKWDGTSWSPLGSGIDGFDVRDLAVFDDGSGPRLYAVGQFWRAGGLTARSIARWDGTNWSALGSGLNSWAFALAVFDDGGGPRLYAGGEFTTAGGQGANRIAKWDGTSWSALGGGGMNDGISTLNVFDDGSGPKLYAGGTFTSAGGVAANRIASWDGAGWSALGGGMNGDDGSAVLCLTTFDDGSGPALFAGGFFPGALDSGDSVLAKWGCPDTTAPTLTCPADMLVGDRFASPAGEVVRFAVTASDDRDPAPSIVCVPPSGSLFPRGRTRVTCTATDHTGNVATCSFTVSVARGIH